MNYIVVSLLYDQFDELNREFGKCIDDRGEFSGNFERFRRRHQAVSRSVGEADRFLMICNVAGFCCQIVNIILVLYSIIFYRKDVVSFGPSGDAVYLFWLATNLFSLSLASGLAVVINRVVSLDYL